MMSDLFTTFDYAWGGGFAGLWLSMWGLSLLIPIFTVSTIVFWFSSSNLESAIWGFIKGFSSALPGSVKMMSGGAHLFVTLLLLLLFFNVGGAFPFSYPLSSHFVVSLSLAFPFWLMTFFLNFNYNWVLFWLISIREGGYLVPTLIAMFSEWVSIVLRPVALMCRLTVNIIVGKILMSLVSATCVGLFYPFSWVAGGSVLGPIFAWVFLYGLFLFELCVAVLQACIFVGLLVAYIQEVAFKPSYG